MGELSAVRLYGRYKAVFMTPNYDDGLNNCPTGSICGCTGNFVTKHQPPLLFDIREDPSESSPLHHNYFSQYDAIMTEIDKAVEHHQKSFIEHRSQPNHMKYMWDPRLLPCCEYPICKCDKDSDIVPVNISYES